MKGAPPVLYRPGTVGEAVRLLAQPDAEPLAGGTDLVPALRAGAPRPRAIVSLRRVLELRVRGVGADALTVGAAVTYTELAEWSPAPGLAAVARCVGSLQVRNAGTVGGALGSANPRGDLLTFLTAADAQVLLCSARGPRVASVAEFLAGGRRRGDLVTAVRLPPARGPQVFFKIGGRQAAYPALVSCAVVVDRLTGRVGAAVGGIATAPLRVTAAEEFAASEVDWSARGAFRGSAQAVARRFGELVSAAARQAPAQLPAGQRDPVDYRCHAVGVLAARALARCLAAPAQPSMPVGVGA